jgi:hypothetical protein
MVGYDIADKVEYKNLTLENYGYEYNADPDIIDIGIEYLTTILKEISPNKATAGDILFSIYNGLKSFGIDGGNGFMVVVSEKAGVQLVEKKYYDIKKAFKCQRRYR